MSTGYMWNGSQWRQLSAGYMWNGSQWRQINSGWMWNGSQWRQIFSSGTFQPEIRDVSGNVIDTRAVNNLLYGYRGSNTAATYTFTWQYGVGQDYEANWATQTGAGATGTLTGATLTTTYQTTTTDVIRLESALNDYILYMRFRVVRSGETQTSNVVRIHKRIASQTVQTNLGYRFFDIFQTSYNWSLRNPYSGDRLTFWSASDWSNTSEITNDRRPDYYIFTYTIDGEITVKDSRDEDPADPRTPTLASRFQVPFASSYLGKPVFYEIEAHTSSPSSPAIVSGQTRNVSDGTLQAPTNPILQYNYFLYPNKLYMTWEASDGGNNNTITYTWRIYRDNVFIASGNVTGGVGTGLFGLYPSTGALNVSGTYKFEVRAAQSGSTTVTSVFSNEITVEAPSAFTYSISNITTTDGIPGDFTILPFAQNTSIINRVELDWTDSTNANLYQSEWFRPSGTSSSINTNVSNDYWGYSESGNYTSRITARNEIVQRIRISWTKPAGTSALSYRITYARRVEATFITTTVDVGDVTNYDLSYRNDSATSPSIQITNIIAYSTDTAGEGLSRSGSPTSNFLDSSSLQEVGIRQKSRTEYLEYIIPSVGSVTVTGEAEPGQSLTFTYSGTWTPPVSDTGWVITRVWGVTRDSVGAAPIFNRGTGSSVSPTTSDIGEYILIRLTATYKNTSALNTTGSSDRVVPALPTFTATNNGNSTFTVSSVVSSGAGFYFGSYTGGSISERSISTNFTSSVLTEGNKTIIITGRAKKTFDFVQEIIDGRRSASTTLEVTNLGAFTYSIADTTPTPGQPNAYSLTWAAGTSTPVNYNWNDTTNTTSWFSSISGGPEGARSNERFQSDDFWSTTAGNSYTAQVYSRNTNGRVTVSWGSSTGANSYRINYIIAGTNYTTLVSGSTFSYDFAVGASSVSRGLAGETFSIISVVSYNSIDGSGSSRVGTLSGASSSAPYERLSSSRFASGTAPTPVVAPGVPQGVSVSPSGLVTWSAPTSGGPAAYYEVQHQRASTNTGTSPSTAIVTNVGSSTSFQIPSITGKIWARARVRAGNTAGVSGYNPAGYTAWA